MKLIRHTLGLLLLTAAWNCGAQANPDRPVRIVVNTPPAGLTDVATRVVAQKMSEHLGTAVVVENRGGGDGVIAARYVLSQPADGTTLLATASSIAIRPAIKLDPGYDLVKDFAGVGPILRSPLFLLVPKTDPSASLSQLAKQAREKPNQLSYASGGVGSTTHMAAAMFLRRSGLQMLHVPYKGNGLAMADVAAGRVNLIFAGAQQLRTGQFKALAVTSDKRLAGYDEVPTFAEHGVPDYRYYLTIGLLAPAGTPKAALERLAAALSAATADNQIRQRFKSEGAELLTASPEEFKKLLTDEMTDAVRLVSELGIKKE